MNKDEARNELLKSMPVVVQGSATIVTLGGANRQEGEDGASAEGKPELSRVLGELSGQVALMSSASRAMESALEANTRATSENTQSQRSGGSSEVLSKVGSGLSAWFGLSPIAMGLQALLGREKAPVVGPALARYDAAPAPHRALSPRRLLIASTRSRDILKPRGAAPRSRFPTLGRIKRWPIQRRGPTGIASERTRMWPGRRRSRFRRSRRHFPEGSRLRDGV